MNIFTVKKEAIGKLATKKILGIFPLILFAISSSLIIVNHVENNEIVEDPVLAGILGILTLGFLIAGTIMGRKKIAEQLYDTKYVLKEDSVERLIPNFPTVTIAFRDIRIYRRTKSGILLKTKGKHLLIPKQLTDFETLQKGIKNNVQTSHIYNDTKFRLNETLKAYLLSVSFLALIVGLFVVEGKILKLSVGIPLLLVSAYTLFHTLIITKDKSLDSGLVGKAMLWILVLAGYLIYVLITY